MNKVRLVSIEQVIIEDEIILKLMKIYNLSLKETNK